MEKITYSPIGMIRSPYKKVKGAPIQTAGGMDVPGRIELLPEYVDGLMDLEGFSHVILIYHFHLSRECSLRVKPFLDDNVHGVFATRAPARPNPIGLSTVRLVRVEGTVIHFLGVDVLDGTPLLDIKPYVPRFDRLDVERCGWLEGKEEEAETTRADERFGKEIR